MICFNSKLVLKVKCFVLLTEAKVLRKCEERRNLQCLNSNKQEAV